jgi:repressor LexA
MKIRLDRLDELIKKKFGGHGAKTQFAAKMGVILPTAHGWISGRRAIPNDKFSEIAKLLDTTIDYLFGFDPIPVKEIPIIGTASCGAPETMIPLEKRTAYYRADFWKEELYAVVASGDSMNPYIEDGDEVICDPTAPVKHGDIVHYRLRNDSAIKLYLFRSDANIILLKPRNATEGFKTRIVRLDDEEYNDLILVKVITVNRLNFSNTAARLKDFGEA